ncbi:MULTISPECIES: PD-(D/E)XK nuclease family protein [unclassified Wenzhouxiangella]|uniref:PD-(D/E)XK nuclease family protein n=1 Tax=unclassified Wenzhouxiangella TaxID=2613841 RepID=UPI000E326121|nr:MULTISPECIES: PD-(D/E)XK nuclease family protein [unclassified Wenzhouxiangella]RFF28819.1 hypothetical protein DZK25_00660 [Wenzhouxiangella sp. 15181]RFP68204.1 hypothetical protein DZK26_09410 [Wenzhouxiangella sp. 15190]
MIGDQTLILTPTARLARAEKQRQALARQSAGEQAWRSPEVLAFPSWIGRLRDDWFLTAEAPRVPISASQALVLWQSVIDRDVFIGEPRVAEMVAASWRLVHEYCIDEPSDWPDLMLSEDSRHFRDWAGRFSELCKQRGLIDEWRFAGRLPDLIKTGEIGLPAAIRLSGFELAMTPLQRAILQAAEAAGVHIESAPSREDAGSLETVIAHAEEVDELVDAARWARGLLEEKPDQIIAVVVPGLRDRLGTVERVFRRVFDPPGFALDAGHEEPWHISLGPTLARWPLVADALSLLRIDPHRISQPQVAALLRSPFLSGWEAESRARAGALSAVIRYRPYWLHAGQLAWQIGESGAKELSGRLAEWELLRREHRDTALPSQWVVRFQKELEAMGFGRGRGLDSREFQVLQRFHDLLEDFSALDLVIERPISRAEAVRRLNERAATAAFRERNPGAPIEILGVEEALGSRFDAMRVTSLDHQTWPSPTRRDPFIPASLQADAPAASAESALERARGELDGLARTAPIVTGSFSRGSDDEQRHLTPLLSDCPVEEAAPNETAERAEIETLPEDTLAPEHPGGEVRGGTSVLQRQSDCPFRAFAERRLGAGDLTPPRPGLDARDRGSLVHKALEHFWSDLDGLDALESLGESALAERIAAARDAALKEFARRNPLALTKAGLAIEAQCLERALSRWLAIERERAPFSVTARETKVELAFDRLHLTGKIDRVDELEGGGSVVIDYKTGASGKNGWAPEAPLADVQLPAYATSLQPRPVAIAFARLRPDNMGFDGLAEVDAGIDGVQVIGEIKGRSKFGEIESWRSLVDEWRRHLNGLAADFLAGRSQVEPRDNQVCKYCHLHALCRINERVILPEADDE